MYQTIVYSLIESFIFPYFLSSCFEIKQKKQYIFHCVSFSFLVLFLNEWHQSHLFWLPLFIVFVCVHLLENHKETIKFDYSIIALVYYFMLVSLDMIILFVVQYLWQLDNTVIFYIIKTSVLVVVTFLMLHYKRKYLFSLSIMKWYGLIFIEVMMFFMLLVLKYFIISLANSDLFFIGFAVMILNILFLIILWKVNNLQIENIKLVAQQQNQQFNDEKVQLIKNIKSEIDAIDHRLFYVIYKIDHLLENNETEKIKQVIDEYKAVVTKHNMIVETGNTVFDCLLSLKINDLIINNIDVKSCIFISQHEKYDNLTFINFLIRLLDCFLDEKNIELFMSEEPGFIMVKILHGNQSDLLKIDEYLQENMIKVDGDYNINNETQEVKVIVKRDS